MTISPGDGLTYGFGVTQGSGVSGGSVSASKLIELLLQLPQSDATGKIIHGDWEDTRTDDILLLDHEGLIKTIPDGDLPYQDGRVVQNFLISTEDFSAGIWVKGATCTVTGTNIINFPAVNAYLYQRYNSSVDISANVIVFRVELSGSGTISLRIRQNGGTSQAETIQVTLSSTPQAFSLSMTASAGVVGARLLIFRDVADTATTVTANYAQLENVTGHAIQTPGEYISSTENVGLAYYATANANTVDGFGVVAEAVGIALSPVPNLVHYPASENYYINSDAPVTQTIDLTAVGTGDYTVSVIGSGTVTSADIGATGTGHGAASEGTDITFNLSVAGTVSFTVAGGPPDYVQVEKKAFSTPPIVTAGSSVPRDVTDIQDLVADNINLDSFTLRAKMTPIAFAQVDLSATDEGIVSIQDSATSILFMDSGGFKSTDGINTATVNPSFAADTEIEIVVRASAALDELQIGYNDGAWVWGSVTNYTGSPTAGTNINLFFGLVFGGASMGMLEIYNKEMSTAAAEALL